MLLKQGFGRFQSDLPAKALPRGDASRGAGTLTVDRVSRGPRVTSGTTFSHRLWAGTWNRRKSSASGRWRHDPSWPARFKPCSFEGAACADSLSLQGSDRAANNHLWTFANRDTHTIWLCVRLFLRVPFRVGSKGNQQRTSFFFASPHLETHPYVS